MKKISVLGSINMDLVVSADQAPHAGETLPGKDFSTIPGGKGANQAVAAARLGGDVSMIGRLGSDIFGEDLRKTLEDNQIKTEFVFTEESISSGVALIVVEKTGQNRILVVAGANGKVSTTDVDRADGLLKASHVFVTQLETPIDTAEYAIQKARQYGNTVIFNPAPAPTHPLPETILHHTDMLVVNESEAGSIMGRPIASIEEGLQGCHALRKRTEKTVILTMGEKGAIAENTESSWYVPAFKIDVIDTTAAGDAFIGALAANFNELQLPDLLIWANAAGAIAATKFGAQVSLPNRIELEDFLLKRSKEIEVQKKK